jgi:hypothetical protein
MVLREKLDLKKEEFAWIHLAQNMDQQQALVITVKKLPDSINDREFFV